MIKINTLQLENVKRIKAVQLDLTGNALTIIGGKNGQGKTSVLDAICWALGGDRFRPTNPDREGSVIPAEIRIELSNGIIVERKGKQGALKVTDPSGSRAGQTLLNSFVEQFALDLPKFMQQNPKDKARTLLQIIGIEDELKMLEKQEQELYARRHAHGQHADSRKKYADELPSFPDAPEEKISVSRLIKQQQEILAKNGENQKLRNQLARIEQDCANQSDAVARIKQQIKDLQEKLTAAESREKELYQQLETARKTADVLQDESTAELEAQIQNAEEINNQVSANQAKAEALQEAELLQEQYSAMTAEIEAVRSQKLELLNNAKLPLPALSVQDGELTYNGQKWDCMSGSDQLKVATAIIRKLNPECGFVLLDKLEQMDTDTLKGFAAWLQSEDLQVIATRVSTGDECSVIIEDGAVIKENKPSPIPPDPALLHHTGTWDPTKF